MRRTYPKFAGAAATKTVPTGTAETIGTVTDAYEGILVQSLSTNTVSVYIGNSAVTVATGIELEPGDDVFLAIQNMSEIYCISGSASQALRVIAL